MQKEMYNCKDFGLKHKMKLAGVTDYFLMGNLYFSCEHCYTHMSVDRLYFYLSMLPHRGRSRRGT